MEFDPNHHHIIMPWLEIFLGLLSLSGIITLLTLLLIYFTDKDKK